MTPVVRGSGLSGIAFVMLACAGASTPVPSSLDPAAGERLIPYRLVEPPRFSRAVARGTRTRTGTPGAAYWQQWTTYHLEGTLDPATATLTGRARIRYENRSPDTLPVLFLHLHPNIFAADAPRTESVPVTRGMQLETVRVNGSPIASIAWRDSLGTGHAANGTTMRVRLRRPLAPASSIDLDITWRTTVPPEGAPRGGQDGEVWMVSYWYPQMAVYDDIGGWQTDPYLGTAEFYMGYGDYTVALTTPAGWLVAATGTLTNAAETLSREARARLDSARLTGRVTRIAAANDGTSSDRRTTTWRWEARNVRDFAFALSPRYVWDATIATAGDRASDGRPDTAMIHTFYRPGRKDWDKSAAYVKHSVEFLSRYLWSYAYPQMTAIDGPESCSGMEFPMLTCIGGERDTLSLYGVLNHETAHMWFPMEVGSDEKRHAWQDEGLTRFNQAQAMREFFRGYDRLETPRKNYYRIVGAGDEVELMRHGDLYPSRTSAYGVASYDKMSLSLVMLRAILGDETFLRAYREYGRRWSGKHPSAFDFFNAFEDVAGRDLDWFWRTWFYETWTLDQAIASVSRSSGGTTIEIEDRGMAPMPVRLAITRENGTVERIELPVDVWLRGARRTTHRVSGAVTKVEIDPESLFLDVDRSNNAWAISY